MKKLVIFTDETVTKYNYSERIDAFEYVKQHKHNVIEDTVVKKSLILRIKAIFKLFNKT